MTSYLRPDEKTKNSSVEHSRNQDEKLKTGLKTAANVGLAATGVGVASKVGGALSSRILPFINEYIPVDMALKGISKISPELGNTLTKGMHQGLDIKDGLSFLKGQIEGNEKAKKNGNIIQQYDDKLHEKIEHSIKKGLTAAQAVGMWDVFPDFQKSIKKIEKDHKIPFVELVDQIYGGNNKSMDDDPMNPTGSSPERPSSAESQAFNQQSGQAGNSQAKQQIMQAMQALSQKLRT